MLSFALGSTNPAKLLGVSNALKRHGRIGVEVQTYDVSSGVAGQPISLSEIIAGASNRARGAFVAAAMSGKHAKYGIGIESGVMRIDSLSHTWVDVTACIIDSGGWKYYGQSFGFVVPRDVMELVLTGSYDLSDAVRVAGLTSSEKVGNSEGLIGILSGGVDDRASQVESAARMAFMQILSPHYNME